ncbi:MAG: hypothetical protein Q8N63_05010 [Nanoarchaeota archaeon]|nr:hypothetical protein [Nanoarchaeota archaeon]
MKKSVVIVLLAILILILGLIIWQNFEENSRYKGELGEASPRPQNLSVYVLPAIPILTIISPENITYSTSTILLNYSVTNEVESIWYNLDNTSNITITSPISFNAAEGSHVLYLYANNSQGASSKSITFSVKIETQPPDDGGGGGGGSGSIENKTEQQENITLPHTNLTNTTEQETPKNATPISETPRTIREITIKFVISLLFLILLIILIIFLIAIIKRKKDRKKVRQKKK